VRTVVVPATVTDEAGRFVRTLTRDDFEVRDNGRPQALTVFQKDVQPITAVLLVDASASMLRSLTPVIASVNEFIMRLLPGDQARLGSFAEDIRLSPAFTGDRDALLKIWHNEFDIRIGRRTRLWDAMLAGISALSQAESRRVLLVITDGQDTWSLKTLEDVQSEARRHNVAIYAVRFRPASREGQLMEMRRGPDGSAPGRRDVHAPITFENLARDTGGGFMQIEEQNGWQPPFTQIALDLHTQYILGFTPAVLDGKVHAIDVRVRQPRLRIRFRRSYLASEEAFIVATKEAGRD
jgi:Ca-activated chloride channel family protein